MDKELKNGWGLTVDGNKQIRLHDSKVTVRHKEYTGSLSVSKFYNVFVNKNDEISVSGTIRRSFPKLPKYVKEGVIEFAKEVHGDKEYKILNE